MPDPAKPIAAPTPAATTETTQSLLQSIDASLKKLVQALCPKGGA